MLQSGQVGYARLPGHERIFYDRDGKILGINCIIDSDLRIPFRAAYLTVSL